jgi:hypothetical protein
MKKQKPVISHLVRKMELHTVNRGVRTFIISKNEQGYYASELGGATQWARITGTDEIKAHSLNKTRRIRGKYGYRFRPIPYTEITEAETAIHERANTKVIYGTD